MYIVSLDGRIVSSQGELAEFHEPSAIWTVSRGSGFEPISSESLLYKDTVW